MLGRLSLEKHNESGCGLRQMLGTWRRRGAALIAAIVFTGSLLVGTPQSARADYIVGHLYLTNYPGPPYDATSSYEEGHVIDQQNNMIYITITNYTIYNNANNSNIGFQYHLNF